VEWGPPVVVGQGWRWPVEPEGIFGTFN